MPRIPSEPEIHAAARELGIDPETMTPHTRTKVVQSMHVAAAEERVEKNDETQATAFALRCASVQDALSHVGVWAPTIERVVGALAPTLWKEAARHDD